VGQDGILLRVVDRPAEGRMQASTGGLPIRRRFTTRPTMHSPKPVKHPSRPRGRPLGGPPHQSTQAARFRRLAVAILTCQLSAASRLVSDLLRSTQCVDAAEESD
jgi:hypothetical protein